MLALLMALTIGAPPTTREFAFDGPGDGRKYAARLTVPAQRTGAAVLLIGGGGAFDLHWTTPGSIMSDGHPVQLTLDGKDTRDADALAEALAERGLIVMQWSLVHTEDRIVDGMVQNAVPFEASVAITREALAALRRRAEIRPDQVILVGHSLGATRAFALADEGTLGVVSRAGAYLDRTRTPSRRIVQDEWPAFATLDGDRDGRLSRAEFESSPEGATRLGLEFADVDRDADGVLRSWELAAAAWLARAHQGRDPRETTSEFRPSVPWPVDVMAGRPELKCLMISGGIDDLSFHAALVEGRRLPNVQAEFRRDLGHMLSEERDHRSGPMSSDVVKRVAEWSAALASQPPASGTTREFETTKHAPR